LSSSGGSRGIRDVTEEFTVAAKQLQPGQLVKDEYFTLFEAVGALEVSSVYSRHKTPYCIAALLY